MESSLEALPSLCIGWRWPWEGGEGLDARGGGRRTPRHSTAFCHFALEIVSDSGLFFIVYKASRAKTATDISKKGRSCANMLTALWKDLFLIVVEKTPHQKASLPFFEKLSFLFLLNLFYDKCYLFSLLRIHILYKKNHKSKIPFSDNNFCGLYLKTFFYVHNTLKNNDTLISL